MSELLIWSDPERMSRAGWRRLFLGNHRLQPDPNTKPDSHKQNQVTKGALSLVNGLRTGQTIKENNKIAPNNDSISFIKERFHLNKGGIAP